LLGANVENASYGKRQEGSRSSYSQVVQFARNVPLL